MADDNTPAAVAQRARSLMDQGYHCSEAIVIAVGEHVLGSVDETTRRISTAFRGGMGATHQEACGALSGGLIVIGARYGRTRLGEEEEICKDLATRYYEQFAAAFHHTRCADLLASGYGSSGTTPCSVLVERAARILLDVFDQEQP